VGHGRGGRGRGGGPRRRPGRAVGELLAAVELAELGELLAVGEVGHGRGAGGRQGAGGRRRGGRGRIQLDHRLVDGALVEALGAVEAVTLRLDAARFLSNAYD